MKLFIIDFSHPNKGLQRCRKREGIHSRHYLGFSIHNWIKIMKGKKIKDDCRIVTVCIKYGEGGDELKTL